MPGGAERGLAVAACPVRVRTTQGKVHGEMGNMSKSGGGKARAKSTGKAGTPMTGRAASRVQSAAARNQGSPSVW